MPRKGVHKGAHRALTLDKSREIPFREEDGQSYAVVLAMLGNKRLRARCEDCVERLCIIRGSMRRSEWISPGDVILVSLRDFQDEKADVIHRYPHDDVRRLRRLGELGLLLRYLGAATDSEIPETDLVIFEDGEGGNELDLDFI